MLVGPSCSRRSTAMSLADSTAAIMLPSSAPSVSIFDATTTADAAVAVPCGSDAAARTRTINAQVVFAKRNSAVLPLSAVRLSYLPSRITGEGSVDLLPSLAQGEGEQGEGDEREDRQVQNLAQRPGRDERDEQQRQRQFVGVGVGADQPGTGYRAEHQLVKQRQRHRQQRRRGQNRGANRQAQPAAPGHEDGDRAGQSSAGLYRIGERRRAAKQANRTERRDEAVEYDA